MAIGLQFCRVSMLQTGLVHGLIRAHFTLLRFTLCLLPDRICRTCFRFSFCACFSQLINIFAARFSVCDATDARRSHSWTLMTLSVFFDFSIRDCALPAGNVFCSTVMVDAA
jgi:hypothetical protein